MVDVSGSIFLQLAIIFIIAAIAVYLLRLLKQPQILAYVLVGVLIGPVYTLLTGKILVDFSTVESMSIIGIAFLLFIVGLEMDLKSLRSVALVSSLGGSLQMIIIFVFGYLLALLLGFLSLEAAYIGLLLSFSSTMVVMKILSDRRELSTLHGRLSVGLLVVQDIVAIFALSVLTSINGFTILLFVLALTKFLLIFAIAYIASKYLFPEIFRFAARNQELLLVSSLAVCFLFSLAFYFMGFSIAIGAFLAGVTLGNLHYNYEIIGKIRNLKDFFSLLFFVSLGMGLSLAIVKEMWLEIILLLVAVLILKPFVTLILCCFFKYTKKPSFLAAMAHAQIGEFSLILATQGLALGHISENLFSLILMVTIISITFTSYYIDYSTKFYRMLQKPLHFLDRFSSEQLEYIPNEIKPKIVLCGHNRIGYSILRDLKEEKKDVLVVDYNPDVIAQLVRQGYHCIYGEATDEEILERMNLRQVELLISTVPSLHDNILLIKKLRQANKRAKIIVNASDIEQSLQLYKQGADYVILPHFLGGEHAAQMILKLRKKQTSIDVERRKHIEDLKERQRLGQRHPKV